jgi:hypothetical protein
VVAHHGIQPIQQFSYTTGKNAGLQLIIDAMDVLHTAASSMGFALEVRLKTSPGFSHSHPGGGPGGLWLWRAQDT